MSLTREGKPASQPSSFSLLASTGPVVEVDEADDSLSDDEEEGVATIPETAREYEEESAADKSEPPNITGVEIKVTSGSQKSSREGGVESRAVGEELSETDDGKAGGDMVEGKTEETGAAEAKSDDKRPATDVEEDRKEEKVGPASGKEGAEMTETIAEAETAEDGSEKKEDASKTEGAADPKETMEESASKETPAAVESKDNTTASPASENAALASVSVPADSLMAITEEEEDEEGYVSDEAADIDGDDSKEVSSEKQEEMAADAEKDDNNKISTEKQEGEAAGTKEPPASDADEQKDSTPAKPNKEDDTAEKAGPAVKKEDTIPEEEEEEEEEETSTAEKTESSTTKEEETKTEDAPSAAKAVEGSSEKETGAGTELSSEGANKEAKDGEEAATAAGYIQSISGFCPV